MSKKITTYYLVLSCIVLSAMGFRIFTSSLSTQYQMELQRLSIQRTHLSEHYHQLELLAQDNQGLQQVEDYALDFNFDIIKQPLVLTNTPSLAANL